MLLFKKSHHHTTLIKPFHISVSLISFVLLSFLSTPVFSVEESSQITPESRLQAWKSFNTNTVENYILPAYENLDKQAQSLDKAIVELCIKTRDTTNTLDTASSLNAARNAFHQTMDAWQFLQNIQFGPIQTLMRNYTMQFWPDKKNHVSKHLAILLETDDPAALTDSEFHKASVSIKGLPAIERFLFEEDETKRLLTKPFHCQVLQRITSYTANSSKSLVVEWKDMQSQFSNASQPDGYFEDDIDATTALLKSLVEPIEVIRDLKILRPLGSEFGQQKMRRLESWRSQRSLRNIAMNIESLEHLYAGLNTILSKEDKKKITDQFKQVSQEINNISSPIESAIETKNGFHAFMKLSDSLKNLHTMLDTAVSNQGIHLGFNSRDGD